MHWLPHYSKKRRIFLLQIVNVLNFVSMSKKIITWVCIVLPFAFIGLVFMQVRWIVEACKLRDSMFDQTVVRCIDNVITRLETDELVESRTGMQSSSRNFTSFSKNRHEAGAGKVSDEMCLSFRLDKFGFYKLDVTKGGTLASIETGVVDASSVLGNDMMANSFTALNSVLSRKLRLLNIQASKSVFEESPIEVRVNPQRLDALLMQQFTDNGINSPYEFAVYNSAGVKAFSSPAYDSGFSGDTFDKRLYPNDVHSKEHYVKVYFPNRPNVAKGLMVQIVPTTFFCLVAMILSAYTVIIIFRQKKLDVIKNDFISNMTHEFKTPISTMSLSAQMLRDLADTVKPDFIRRNTGIIIDEAKRLTIQVEKILQMSTFDRGKGRLKLEERNINEIVDKVVNTFRVKVESANGEINERLDAADPIAMVDNVHFTNVIYNLLDNAFKYRRDAPMLHVWTRNANGGIIISIKDNGLGISKEDQKRIFEKFYRVSTGDKHDIKGFGLGLAYVKKIVEDHGGQISVESELNVGTKFDIYLPLIK